jgi:pimeloyl-ACP methyl ester carboxylesterase
MKRKTAGISYLEAGAGQPVVCLHGIGGGAESFQHQLAGGFDTFTLRALDLPGYGGSDPITPMTFQGLSERLSAFLDELGTEKVHLVGHSIGGMLALDHAIRVPDQVATLTLIGTTSAFGGKDDSFKTAFLKARLEPLERGLSMAEMARETAPHLVGPNATPGVADEVADILAQVSKSTWRAILECLVTFNRRADLARVAQPCLLIAGEHDTNAPSRTMKKMAQNLQNAEFHIIRGAGHIINQEDSVAVNDLLRYFFRRHRL